VLARWLGGGRLPLRSRRQTIALSATGPIVKSSPCRRILMSSTSFLQSSKSLCFHGRSRALSKCQYGY
jgi:hypothetical protein